MADSSSKTRVEAITGKGYGLVAATDLKPGEVILEQPPLMLVDYTLDDEEVRDTERIKELLTPLIQEKLQGQSGSFSESVVESGQQY